MAAAIQAIRGMNDILPNDTPLWRHLEHCLIKTALSYGYQEIRSPIVEQTALFKRAIGIATDIVEKEMYTFDDRNGDSLTLRPEGTAVCVRAGIEHGLLYNQIQRLWYLGPMFRHERPQKGRYRQFHQFGIEAFGMAGADIEAEIILVSARIWALLGLTDHVVLQINSLGSAETRAVYRQQLVDYFSAHQDTLDDDAKRRLTTNPLRILDSKNPHMQALIANAPVLTDALDDASKQGFDRLRYLLDQTGIVYEINPRLVRGLDYYNGIVFEWIGLSLDPSELALMGRRRQDESPEHIQSYVRRTNPGENNPRSPSTMGLGTQNAICSGGRYDTLVELLGGKPTPAVGFGLGIERVIALLQQKELALQEKTDIYLILVGEKAEAAGLRLAEQWRRASPGLCLIVNCGGGNFKNQFKRADKSGARLAFILGDEELAAEQVSVKFLREEKEQTKLDWKKIPEFLLNIF